MDLGRNDLLGELANDAALERTDFLVQATEQLQKFLDRNRDRISQLGGLTLVDDDPDYLSIAPDCTFRVRSRYEDPDTGEWVTDTEVVDTASELIELYNPAEIFAAFAEAAREAAGFAAEPTATDDLLGAAGVAPEETFGLGVDDALRRRRRLVGRGPAGGARRRRRGGGGARAVQPRARLPGAEPAERGAAARPVRGGLVAAHGSPRRPDHRGRRRRAARPRRHRPVPRRGPARGQRRRVARADRRPTSWSSSTTRPTSSGTSRTRWPRRSRASRPSSRRRRRGGAGGRGRSRSRRGRAPTAASRRRRRGRPDEGDERR